MNATTKEDMNNVLTHRPDGKIEWTTQAGDAYIVTGRLYNSDRRFRIQTSSAHHALGINLWNGNVWLVRNGRRHRIKQVIN